MLTDIDDNIVSPCIHWCFGLQHFDKCPLNKIKHSDLYMQILINFNH